jgi:hypothetical protein
MNDDGTGKPLMRPTTPLKSSQAHRANNSQITDNSHMSYHPQPNPLEHLIQKQREFEESLPEELKPKPLIPRTPMENEQRPNNTRENEG